MEKIPHPSEYFDYLAIRAVFTAIAVILLGLFVSYVLLEAKRLDCISALATFKYTVDEINQTCGAKND